jgi:hypothetical protein
MLSEGEPPKAWKRGYGREFVKTYPIVSLTKKSKFVISSMVKRIAPLFIGDEYSYECIRIFCIHSSQNRSDEKMKNSYPQVQHVPHVQQVQL